jgi:thiamine-monophosphate kinase
MKMRELGEFGFIDRIKKDCLVRSEGIIKAMGDDCAVLKSTDGSAILLTTDMLVEDVHFKCDQTTPILLGRKSLAVNISDIAAMGGNPKEALVAIAIPEETEIEFLDGLYDGIKSIAAEYDINLLGGDTVSSPENLVISITLMGEAAEDEVLYRSGASVGDIIFLTGTVGSSAAGLDIAVEKRRFAKKDLLLAAHFDPVPHVKAGLIMASSKAANSLIDVSDGVASDLRHICTESGVGAIIEFARVPVTQLLREYCKKYDLSLEELALHGGEDYVLLGTAPEKSVKNLEKALKSDDCSFFPVGEIVEERRIMLKDLKGDIRELTARGYDHFGANRPRTV